MKYLIRYNPIADCDPEYQERIKDIAQFHQQLPFDTDFQVLESSDLDQAFAEVSADSEWVVVVSLGHCSQDRNMYDKAIAVCKENNVKLMCHLLDFKDQYIHFHPQFFVIHYPSWIKAGRPRFGYDGEEQQFTGLDYIPSKDTYHDDYTPVSLRPGLRRRTFQVHEMQTGAWVIKNFLDKGFSIINVTQKLRDNTFHLYPDIESDEFYNFLKTGEYTGSQSSQEWYVGLIKHLARNVKHQFYPLNTEPVGNDKIDFSINNFICVASGLKPWLLPMYYANETDPLSINFCDFSDAAVQFQQHLSTWSGEVGTFNATVQQFLKEHPEFESCDPPGAYDTELVRQLTNINIAPKVFQAVWSQIPKDQPCSLLNLYTEEGQDQIINIVANNDTTYVWLSNAFYMEYALVTVGKKKVYEYRQRLIDGLTATGKRFVLDLMDPWQQGPVTFND